MREGDTASYGHVALHGYENSLRVCIEVLDHRYFENSIGNYVEQWRLEIVGHDRNAEEEDVVTEEVIISISEKESENMLDYQDHEIEFGTIIWVVDERFDEWKVNHNQIVAQYSRYDSRETITSAVLSLIEDVHLVF